MRDSRLPQTLILDPETRFETLARTMAQLGWQRTAGGTSESLLPGEPEAASWSWEGHKPFVIYSYNPVVHLRVLDVATLPPVFRRPLADTLPLLTEAQIEQRLFAPEPRGRLLGLWAARETERLDLIQQADRLTTDSYETVAEQAREVAARLRRIHEARLETRAQLQLLTNAAPDLIRRLDDPDFVAGLQPSRSDCEQLFDATLAEAAYSAAAQYYRSGLQLHPIDPRAEIQVWAAPAGLLRWSNEISDKFSGGYRDIAGWMASKRIWLCWRIIDPGGSRVQYDGLAWLGERWVWLPKIHRDLAPLCLSGRAAGVSTH